MLHQLYFQWTVRRGLPRVLKWTVWCPVGCELHANHELRSEGMPILQQRNMRYYPTPCRVRNLHEVVELVEN